MHSKRVNLRNSLQKLLQFLVHQSLDLNDTRFERIRFKRIYFCDQKIRFKREIPI